MNNFNGSQLRQFTDVRTSERIMNSLKKQTQLYRKQKQIINAKGHFQLVNEHNFDEVIGFFKTKTGNKKIDNSRVVNLKIIEGLREWLSSI